MNFIEKIERLDLQIRQGSTGNAAELAQKLGISKRSVFNYLKWMKDRGAPITFSRIRKSYIYDQEVEFVATFVSSALRYEVQHEDND
ncbi:helix-turn-helix domain-containing protein [Fulvivirga ulvae]|uniref:HTH domain-containing protein n=1 Tax=Fulvivirga ulvae TaxID=2904245 RepID=UPI001F288515|nr:HTH domain-containing protein [Fulvivirga ulvae]UII34252.1 helix-turn-helix domain-containing protein [Fulvivirga ulvae]